MSGNAGRGAHELRHRALTGFFWSYGGVLGGRVVFFAAMLVLTRVLTPTEFGLVAFTVAILSFFDNAIDLGVGQALVHRSDGRSQDVASTAFWIGIAGAVVGVAVVWLLAPLFAEIGPEEQVKAIFLVLCLQFPLRSFGNIHRYRAAHELEFRKVTAAELLSQLTKATVSVVLALSGAGLWSLVIGQLAGTFVWSVTLWFATSWRPSPVVRVDHARSLVGFGVGVGLTGIVGYASHNIDYLIVGARLGAEELGFYSLAFRLPELLILEVFMVLQSVLFPYWSRLRGSPSDDGLPADAVVRLREVYQQTLRISGIVALPLGAGTAALAVPLVLVVFGEPWRPSATPLALIALWAALSALAGLPGTVYKAIGRTRLLTAMAVVEVGLTIPALWFVAPRGIDAVAATLLAVKVVYLVIQAVAVERVVGVRVVAQARSVLPGLVTAAAIGVIVYPIARAAPPLVAVTLGAALGALVYLVVLRAFYAADLRMLRGLVDGRLRGRGEAAPVSTAGAVDPDAGHLP